MRLAAFQAEFAAYLCGASDTPPVDPDRATIYRNNVRLSLSAALAVNFPVTRALVGEDYFHQAARRFVRNNLPQRPDMADYGAEFPGFLASLPDLDGYPFIPDVARSERAMIEALLAPHAPALTAEAFTTVAPDGFAELRFVAHPSTRLLRSAYAVADLWAAHRAANPDLTRLDPHAPQAMLIVRREERIEWLSLDADAAQFTSTLLSGETIAEAVSSLPDTFDLTEALVQLLQAGIFTGLILPENK